MNELGASPLHGIICMWHGGLNDIPDGWWLCDGTHGTPDLQNRFVRPASVGFSPHQMGGTWKHTHAGTVNPTPTALEAGTEIEAVEPDGDIQTTSAAHDHTYTTSLDWNLPIYYTLCYIMKL